jgi:hypothetical protein
MCSHSGEWWDATTLPGGTSVWVQVRHHRRVLRWRWQVSAYAYRPGYHHQPDRVELLDPTPGQAQAALDALTAPASAVRWRDVLSVLDSHGIRLSREANVMAAYDAKWSAEADLSDGSRVEVTAYRYQHPHSWSIRASLARPRPEKAAGPDWSTEGLVVLRDPAPSQAMAAVEVLLPPKPAARPTDTRTTTQEDTDAR